MIDSLLSALGYAGEAIDKPGRAIRGLLAGRPDEAAAAIPFSDSLGLTDQSRSTSGKDLLSALGLDLGDGIGADAAGFGAEVATDPLTFLGAGAGVRLGRAAERAAVAAGPRYGTTADDLSRMLSGSLTGDIVESKILNSPNPQRLLSEINPNSKLIGNGVEALAFREPNGTVTRLGEAPIGWENTGRPVVPQVSQPTSTMNLPGGFRVERGMPFADNVGDASYWSKRNYPESAIERFMDESKVIGTWENEVGSLPDGTTLADMLRTRSEDLDVALRRHGLQRRDRHFGNVGTENGFPVVIDPGDLTPTMGLNLNSLRGTMDFAPVAQSAEPGAAMNALLNALGSGETIQAGLDPRYRALLGIAGGGGGAIAGATGRAFGQ